MGLPLLIVAGILIKLETDKGQLVIESDVPDIAVRIVGDANPNSEISLKQGVTATRLRAGKYELVINGQSDHLTIDNNQFTIQNGATVVARIRLEPRVKSPSRPSTVADNWGPGAEAEPELLYEGKPLSEWLDMLGRERSTAGLKDAFKACMSLTSPQTSDRITKALLKTVPGLNGAWNLDPEANTPPRTIDRYTSEVLRRANPGSSYYQLWVKEFESADENWRKRLWSYHNYRDYASATAMDPFITWAERLISQPSVVPLTAESDTFRAADTLRLISRDTGDNQQLIERIVTALKSSPLGPEWWLNQPLVHRDNRDPRNANAAPQDANLWPPALKSHMKKMAVEVLHDQKSDRSILAQACMILAHGAELSKEQRIRVLTAVNQHLVAVCADEHAMAETVTANTEFASLMMPNLLPFSHRNVQFSYSSRASKPYLVVELLDLVDELDGKDLVQDGITAVAKRVRPVSKLLNAASQKDSVGTRSSRQGGRGGFGGLPAVALRWPDLVSTDARTTVTVTVRQLWGQHIPTPRDWLMYCILHHPVMYEAPPAPPQQLQ
ncbi:MAG: hypothetical protein GY903_12260 [Fuerstiella sp.]|nr:hypothetical protein [Fuerstiella sp.]MCP4855255.1 hypothetical protein [Fuerstiella sp.]